MPGRDNVGTTTTTTNTISGGSGSRNARLGLQPDGEVGEGFHLGLMDEG